MSNISPLNSITTTVDPSSLTVKTQTAAEKNAMGSETFLKLLVAQLKYQSADSPVDTNQLMQQTATLSQVESMQAMQKTQADSLAADQNLLGSSMIGKTISGVNTLTGESVKGTVTGIKLGTDGPVLKVGDMEVALSTVTEVNAPSTTTASPTS